MANLTHNHALSASPRTVTFEWDTGIAAYPQHQVAIHNNGWKDIHIHEIVVKGNFRIDGEAPSVIKPAETARFMVEVVEGSLETLYGYIIIDPHGESSTRIDLKQVGAVESVPPPVTDDDLQAQIDALQTALDALTATVGAITRYTDPEARIAVAVAPTKIAVENYTILSNDVQQYLRFEHANGCTITIPPSTTTNFRIGTVITLFAATAGQVALAPAAEVTLNLPPNAAGTTFAGENACVQIKKVATDTWDVIGGMELA